MIPARKYYAHQFPTELQIFSKSLCKNSEFSEHLGLLKFMKTLCFDSKSFKIENL